MPCLTPYRGDTSQMLLFKIASCLEASGAVGGGVTSFNGLTGAVTGVISFNGRDGVVVLSLADVAAVADGRYVLKAGDTMTGALVHPDGTAALPSITFTGDLNTGIYHPATDTIGFNTGGVERMRIDSIGTVAIGTMSPSSLVIFHAVKSDQNLAWFTNTAAPSATSGAGFTCFVDALPTAADQRLGFISFGSNGGTGANNSSARITAFSEGVWTSSVVRPTYLTFMVSNTVSNNVEKLRLSFTDFRISTGVRVALQSGANQQAGDAVLVAGTVTVANTTVTANTRVFVSRKTNGGVPGTSFTYTLIAATSFTITSSNVADTSTVSYLLIEVP